MVPLPRFNSANAAIRRSGTAYPGLDVPCTARFLYLTVYSFLIESI
jgi:hypothetical protein